MPAIDWTSDDKKLTPGAFHVEITKSQESVGQASGYPYFLASFKNIVTGQHVCNDVISFAPGAAGMTSAKLKSLGFTQDKKEIEADELVGRRCWISVKVEHQEGYEPRLVVDISAKDGFRVGYKSDAIKPPAAPAQSDSTKEELDDDIPFAFLLPAIFSCVMSAIDAVRSGIV